MRLSAKRLRGPLLRLGAWLLLLSACLGAHLPTASAIWEHDEVPETRGGGGSGRPWWAWEPFLEQSDAPRTPKHLRKGLGHEYSFYGACWRCGCGCLRSLQQVLAAAAQLSSAFDFCVFFRYRALV